MKRLANIILMVLIAVAAISVLLWLFGGDVNGDTANVTPMLVVAYIFIGIAVLALIVMTAMNMGKGRGNSKVGLYVFGGLAVLALILYFTVAKDTTVVGADGKAFSNVFELKITDTMLYLAYFSLAAVVVFLLAGEIRKALK